MSYKRETMIAALFGCAAIAIIVILTVILTQ